MDTKDKDETITLGLLQAIDEGPNINQRRLAKRLGVALGLTNSYIKRSLQKGLIKIKQAPANRYVYYLTPRGFAEKSRLTAQYLSSSLSFYQKACQSCERAFVLCHKSDWKKLLLCGVSELSEIASVIAESHDIEIIGTYDSNADIKLHINKPVWKRHDQITSYDAALLTDLKAPFVSYKSLIAKIPKEQVLVPDILGLNQ